MAERADITPELCRQLLRYEPESGKLYWRPRPREMFEAARHHAVWNARYAGTEAFTAVKAQGHLTGRIMDVQFQAHRVVWAIAYGDWPASDHDVDHINGHPSDNRLQNLRSVPHQANGRNTKRFGSNTSGQTGVSWNRNARKWEAYISDSGRRSLGLFDRLEDARQARKEGEARAGYHANHGR